MASLEKILHHTQNLDLAELSDRLNKLIDSANRLAGNVNEINFKQLGTNAVALVGDFRETARGLQRTLADAQGAINGADLPGFSNRSFAYRTAEAAYERDPYAGFLIPPDQALAEAIRASMRASGVFGRVVPPGSDLAPSLAAEVSVTQLFGEPSPRRAPVSPAAGAARAGLQNCLR